MSSSDNKFYDKESKIWRGDVESLIYGDEDSIGSVAIKKMLQHPEHINQICYQNDRKFTNLEIATRSIQAAQHFQKLPLKQCDIIGVCAANSDYLAPIVFGALTAGLTISTLDPSFDKNGIKVIYSKARPQIMFCDGDNYDTVKDALQECGLSATKIFTVKNHLEGVPNILEFFVEDCNIQDFQAPILEKGINQVAFIVCTSGTTGFPKGVCISHAALLHILKPEMVCNTTYLCFSTLFWISGIIAMVHGTIGLATRIISETPFQPNDFFDMVKRYKVNFWFGTLAQMTLSLSSEKLAESDLSTLQFCIIAGSAVPYSLVEKFQPFAPNSLFGVGYVTSETCSTISTGMAQPNNSCGMLGPNVEVKIIDDEGNSLGPNAHGEVCIRTRFPWAGYFNNPEATKAIYDEDRWIHNGDIGYFNDAGELFLVDRKSEMRKYNNFHFSPTDIEKVISELPQVADVCVACIPDETYGFLPAAAVIKRHGSTIEKSEISQHVVDRMQDFEHLRGGVYFFESFPQTPSGKTMRRKVMEMCEKLRTSEIIKINKANL